MVSAASTLRQIAEDSGSDPRGAVLRAVGDFSGIGVAAQQVLVASYIRPETTRGGIIRVDKALMEDRFQGKVGLVLKIGTLAFQDDSVNKFGGFSVQPGEWAIYRPSDGLELFHVADNGRDAAPIRLFADTSIVGKVDDPWRIY